MDGAALGARFSLATNRLQYCGPADAEPVLYRAIGDAGAHAEARRKLRGFEALYPYLELIGRRHGLDPFDERVVEAYWIGNDLLDGFGPADFASLLEAFVARGMPRSIAERLGTHLPIGALPHHAFHVTYIGVGTVTGHVPTTLENIERCRPVWGEVLARGPERLELRVEGAGLRAGRLALTGPRTESLAFDPRVVPESIPGSTVVLHWGWPALVLSDRQRDALRSATERSFAAANSAWPALRVLG